MPLIVKKNEDKYLNITLVGKKLFIDFCAVSTVINVIGVNLK